MNAKHLVLISCIGALALPASVANGQRRGGGGGRAHVGSMQARSAPSGAYRGSNWSGRNGSGRNWSGRNWSGRNLSGRNWNGRNWSGRNWNGRNWNGDWRRHRNHNHNQFVFFGGFGYPFYGYPYYGYYPYDYYGYGYGYGDQGYGTAIKGTGMAIKGTGTAIKGTATAIVTAEGPRSRSCNAGWLGRATIVAPLMESWDQEPGVRFAPTKVRAAKWACANCEFDC